MMTDELISELQSIMAAKKIIDPATLRRLVDWYFKLKACGLADENDDLLHDDLEDLLALIDPIEVEAPV